MRHSLQYSRMDRDTTEFFQTLFDSLKREMHQEFDAAKARLERMDARQERRLDALEERLRKLENGGAR